MMRERLGIGGVAVLTAALVVHGASADECKDLLADQDCCQFVPEGFVIPCAGAPGGDCEGDIILDAKFAHLYTVLEGLTEDSFGLDDDKICKYYAPICDPATPVACEYEPEPTICTCDFNYKQLLSTTECP